MRVGVIYGGISRERDVSLRTGAAVIKALKALGHTVVTLDAGKNMVRQIMDARMDVAFIALHGRFGEDGTVQGLLEILRIPYTGASYMASAVGMDKIITKKIWMNEGIATPAFQVLRTAKDKRMLAFPLVVKPPKEGSTIGISIVDNEKDYRKAVSTAFGMDSEVLLEKFVKGKEMTVAVVDGTAYTPIEIRPKKGHYDYFSKYTKGATEYIIPPECPSKAMRAMMKTAEKAYAAIKCSGAARVDFILDKNGAHHALEINTIPGMTETSLLPKAMAYHGIGFNELVKKILASARVYN